MHVLAYMQVSTLIDELSWLEEILFAGHTGVVVKLTEAAAESCPEKQPALLESLRRPFTLSMTQSTVPLSFSH